MRTREGSPRPCHPARPSVDASKSPETSQRSPQQKERCSWGWEEATSECPLLPSSISPAASHSDKVCCCMLLRCPGSARTPLARLFSRPMSSTPVSASSSRSGKSRTPHEGVLVLPVHDDLKELDDRDLLVDTHTHVLSTFLACETLVANVPLDCRRPLTLDVQTRKSTPRESTSRFAHSSSLPCRPTRRTGSRKSLTSGARRRR